MRDDRRKISAAFTLLELILVMAILTLVVALVAPSLRGFAAGRGGKDTATMIVTLAHYARGQAAAEGRTYRLNFDPSARAMWLTAENGSAFQPVTSDIGRRITAADGVQMDVDLPRQTDGQYVEFRPSGRTDPARVRLTNKLGDTIEVACLSATESFRILTPGEMSQ